jgi:hypothetical protein
MVAPGKAWVVQPWIPPTYFKRNNS